MELTQVYGMPMARVPEPLQSALTAWVQQFPSVDAAVASPLTGALLDQVAAWRRAYYAARGEWP